MPLHTTLHRVYAFINRVDIVDLFQIFTIFTHVVILQFQAMGPVVLSSFCVRTKKVEQIEVLVLGSGGNIVWSHIVINFTLNKYSTLNN